MLNKIKNNVKSKHFLTYYARQIIEYNLNLGLSKRAISKKLKKDHSVIVREINRNKNPDGKYYADEAQKKADLKSKKTNKRKLETNEWLRKYVEEKIIDKGWSPEQVAGKLKKHPPKHLKSITICHESIYDFIYNGNGKYLYTYLRKSHKQRKKRCYRKKRKKQPILERISIHERLDEINEKKRFGDWESDLILFKKQKENISVQYERKTMLLRIHKMKNKSSKENEQAIFKTLDEFPDYLRNSITFDNGTENVCHINVRDLFGIDTYFCDPYASWQKGGVENINSLIRQYLPKDINISRLADDDIYNIQELINNRPRKSLDYFSPNEVINKELNNKNSQNKSRVVH
ncbi:IS30 family transposase [Patescibacteria group bacterium]|nr:IS30 family transposase [Patescibacteria group bacterium]